MNGTIFWSYAWSWIIQANKEIKNNGHMSLETEKKINYLGVKYMVGELE